MHRGYIKLYRKFVDSGMLSDAPMLQVWCWLLLHATHKPREVSYKGEYFQLKAGDVFASIRTIARNTKNTLGVVKRRLDVLESSHRIERRKTHRGTVVSICKWEYYQNNKSVDNTPNGTQDGTQIERRRNADGTQTEQEQACKNKKKVKKFVPPTVKDVAEYLKEKNWTGKIDPRQFIAHYETSGWLRGKVKIKDWKACVRTWVYRDEKKAASDDPMESIPL